MRDLPGVARRDLSREDALRNLFEPLWGSGEHVAAKRETAVSHFTRSSCLPVVIRVRRIRLGDLGSDQGHTLIATLAKARTVFRKKRTSAGEHMTTWQSGMPRAYRRSQKLFCTIRPSFEMLIQQIDAGRVVSEKPLTALLIMIAPPRWTKPFASLVSVAATPERSGAGRDGLPAQSIRTF